MEDVLVILIFMLIWGTSTIISMSAMLNAIRDCINSEKGHVPDSALAFTSNKDAKKYGWDKGER